MNKEELDQIIITDQLKAEIKDSGYRAKNVYYASEDLHTCQIIKLFEGKEPLLVEESFKFKTQQEAEEWTARRLLSFYMNKKV
jgi:hypothetical protein